MKENQCEYQKAVDRIRKTEGILKDEVKGDMVQAKYKDTSYDECKSMCDDNDKCMNFEHCPDRGLCRLFDQEVYPSEAIGNLQQFFDCSSYLKTCTNGKIYILYYLNLVHSI